MNEPIFEIKEEKKDKGYGKFVISPLEQGYGQTLGTSLRRVMLTSLGGFAVTSVAVSGVKHQFSTLKGMREDIVSFVLNVKKLKFSSTSEKADQVKIDVKGPKEVTGKDIKTTGSLKVVNTELPLAYLNKGASLKAELQVEYGVGYSSADERQERGVGIVPVDASFSPVKRVTYKVEETRVGRLTNYDKLVLEVWTDESIDPKDAIVSATNILMSYYKQIVSPKKVEKAEEEVKDDLGPVGKLSVEEIGLPTRVANALVRVGLDTVEKLSKADPVELAKVRNLGEKSVKIVKAALGEKGVTL